MKASCGCESWATFCSFSLLVCCCHCRVPGVVAGREVAPGWHPLPCGCSLRHSSPLSRPALASWSPCLSSPSSASGPPLSLRFSPCTVLLSGQLLSALKEITGEKKANHLAQVSPASRTGRLGRETWPSSLAMAVLLRSRAPCTSSKHFQCFPTPFSIIC